MDRLSLIVDRISVPLLRISLGVVLLWVGALHLTDPSPVRGLLAASLSPLNFNAFAYALGTAEVVAALLLFAGLLVRYVALSLLILFGGTLTIFVVAPAVTYGNAGFPHLSLAGQFLLKDLVLASASVALASLSQRRAIHTAAWEARP